MIIVTIVIAVFLVPVIIWSGLGHAGDSGTAKMPAVSTIGPEMTPYVLTALEKEKRLLPVTTPSVPMVFMNAETVTKPSGNKRPNEGMTQAERDKLDRWKQTHRHIQKSTQEKAEPFSTIENIPRSRGIEGLKPQERTKLETYLESQKK
jgi:hypothetical protein